MHRFERCQSTESIWEEPERGTFFGTTLRSTQQPMRRISWAASLSPASGRQKCSLANVTQTRTQKNPHIWKILASFSPHQFLMESKGSSSRSRNLVEGGRGGWLQDCDCASSGGSRISCRGGINLVGGRGSVDSRGGYVSKILYVETKESGPNGIGHLSNTFDQR